MQTKQQTKQQHAKQLGVYLHIPFCVRKCGYCDFLSAPADEQTRRNYVAALCNEIRAAAWQEQKILKENYSIKSIFFGGGTPSLLDGNAIGAIMKVLQEQLGDICSEQLEVTMECNPGTVTEEKLLQYRRSGVNRLSFGLQSAHNQELKALGRIHTWETFLESLQAARGAGFQNINVDLMSALPDQTMDSWQHTLEQVAALQPEHISAYSLILEEGTALAAQIAAERRQGIDRVSDEDTDREMYAFTNTFLAEQGYCHYEISNYAKPGFESVHNLSYWECQEYFGFGLGASGFYQGERYCNTSKLAEYLINWENADAVDWKTYREDVTVNSLQEQMAEFMFLGLRKMKGISVREFKQRFGKDYWQVYGEQTERLLQEHLLEQCQDTLYLTARGIDISNTVMAEFV